MPQDDLYTVTWEAEFDPNFDNPIPYQNPNVIASRGIIENITPANPRNKKIDDGQNFTLNHSRWLNKILS